MISITSIYAGACLALLAIMGVTITRAIRGPSAFDRVMAVNMFGTKTVLLLSLLGFLSGRPDFLDISLVYALVNFLSTIAILRFFEGRTPTTTDNDTADTSVTTEE
ncbi:MAG: monovalent cation/H+ antiporter complex subunit F [Desulfuromonadaceae bacterium]|nr:pH regulation protein F [Geobacteraceae bacterium]